MSKFEYPRLPRRDIVEVLAESQIANVSEADLLHPDPDFIFNLYTHVLLHMGILQEDDEQMEFGALSVLENPDCHVHSVQVMNLYNKVRQLIAALKCPKAFTPKDLIKPEPERTELFLSALLNFLIHRETKLNLLKPIGDDITLLEEQKQAAESRISQLNAEIAECEELRERELPQVEELNFKIKELRQTVSGLNKHQMTLKTEIKQVKEKSKEMDDKITEAEYALVRSAQENADLRSKIVQSPDKLQKALEEKKLARNESKNAERMAVQACQDKADALAINEKAWKKMSKHLDQMKDAQEKINSAKSVDKEVKVLKNKLSDDAILLKSLDARLAELQIKADHLKEIKRQLEKEKALSHDEATKELDHVKSEVESKWRELEQRKAVVESVVAEVDAVTTRKKIVKEEMESKKQELNRKCEDIVAEFNNYSRMINNLVAENEVGREVANTKPPSSLIHS